MKTPNRIEYQFVVINPSKEAAVEEVDSDLYSRLDANYNGFSGHELIACYEFDSDWSGWEMHPNGDEVVVLLSGAVSLVLKNGEEQTSILLKEQGQFVVVPKATWHTIKTSAHSKLLFVTPGEGTQHRANV